MSATANNAETWGDTRDCFAWLYDTDPSTEWLRQAYWAMEAKYAQEDKDAQEKELASPRQEAERRLNAF